MRLFPREETFLPQFARGAAVILEAARVLDALAASPILDDERAVRIKQLEHQGDQIAHETFDLLNRTWITPIDREDIHELAGSLDDVADYILASAATVLALGLTYWLISKKT